MKKFLIISLVIIVIIGGLIYYFFFWNNDNVQNDENNNVNATRTSEEQELNNTSSPKQEIEISSFSTKIYTKDSKRQNNLSITCSTLDGHIVKAGKTFSFTGTIGPSTSSKGYEKADIFDADGNKIKGYGGGNCQVSSTLYNAVLETPGLKIIERHEHSNKVPYVKEGKDAAVAYGSVDLKFKNENDFDIKISCSTDKNKVYITLYKLQ